MLHARRLEWARTFIGSLSGSIGRFRRARAVPRRYICWAGAGCTMFIVVLDFGWQSQEKSATPCKTTMAHEHCEVTCGAWSVGRGGAALTWLMVGSPRVPAE